MQVPETKGLTLEEMDDVFGDENSSSVADMERLSAINKRIGLDNFANESKTNSVIHEKTSEEHFEGLKV